ncbi:unnamed protein product [Thlaspi arvense]|uniref:Uncharacterized protein n=1 Tax=Thlaspi arvense TaxID=13288 RepID=A0AAU9TBV4_THLAR|nr:unnamed protein product [Thlaspi arvense]
MNDADYILEELALSLSHWQTLALPAAENPIEDLSNHVHHLPCCIRFDGPAQVSHCFKSKSIAREILESCSSVDIEIDGVRIEEAHFRGRKLQGATISLPSGYSVPRNCVLVTHITSGYILGQGGNPNANGKRRAFSSSTEEDPCCEVKAKFEKLTHWNHDSFPSKDDIFLRSFHWFSIAEALHKPVKVEDLVAVSYGEKG